MQAVLADELEDHFEFSSTPRSECASLAAPRLGSRAASGRAGGPVQPGIPQGGPRPLGPQAPRHGLKCSSEPPSKSIPPKSPVPTPLTLLCRPQHRPKHARPRRLRGACAGRLLGGSAWHAGSRLKIAVGLRERYTSWRLFLVATLIQLRRVADRMCQHAGCAGTPIGRVADRISDAPAQAQNRLHALGG